VYTTHFRIILKVKIDITYSYSYCFASMRLILPKFPLYSLIISLLCWWKWIVFFFYQLFYPWVRNYFHGVESCMRRIVTELPAPAFCGAMLWRSRHWCLDSPGLLSRVTWTQSTHPPVLFFVCCPLGLKGLSQMSQLIWILIYNFPTSCLNKNPDKN
jgi:hypothetical protein